MLPEVLQMFASERFECSLEILQFCNFSLSEMTPRGQEVRGHQIEIVILQIWIQHTQLDKIRLVANFVSKMLLNVIEFWHQSINPRRQCNQRAIKSDVMTVNRQLVFYWFARWTSSETVGTNTSLEPTLEQFWWKRARLYCTCIWNHVLAGPSTVFGSRPRQPPAPILVNVKPVYWTLCQWGSTAPFL